MAAMDPSRYEINRQVKTILTQHGVNTGIIDYSYIGGTVYLTGTIKKNTSDEFTPSGIEYLVRDISRLHGVRDVQFDLNNWTLVRGRASWQIMRRKFRPTPLSLVIPHEEGAVSTDATLEIKKQEQIVDVLKDVKEKKESDTENQPEG
jgi:hypothetical protein